MNEEARSGRGTLALSIGVTVVWCVVGFLVFLALNACAGTTLKYPTKNGQVEYATRHAFWHTMKSDLSVTLMLETNVLGSLTLTAERDSEISEADIKAAGDIIGKLAEGGAKGAVQGATGGATLPVGEISEMLKK